MTTKQSRADFIRTRNWSPVAEDVVDRARYLGHESQTGVTSSCILFALAGVETEEEGTCWFVRKSLEVTGRYLDELDKLLRHSGNASGQRELNHVYARDFEDIETLIISNAENIAVRVSGAGSAEIFPRHIFAALLVTPVSDVQSTARWILTDLGIDIHDLSYEFLGFLHARTDIKSDDFAGWAAILTPKDFPAGPAGYNSEFCAVGGPQQVEDSLDVKDSAYQLADLIALRETKLPLAIGLFGNWGSGKSHFMNLIDQRLKGKMEEARKEGPTSRWCGQIVPVYFNAWHFLDANLWASLVSQIFESLFAYLRPKVDELKKMQQLLEEASGATARAAEEVKFAEGATKQAKTDLLLAQQSRVAQETFVNGLLYGLESLLPEVNTKTIEDNAADLLGIKKEVKTIVELREVVNDAQSLATRVSAVGKKLWRQPGRYWRLAWLATVVLGPAAIVFFLMPQIPLLQDWLGRVGHRLAALLSGISALVLWLRPVFAEANRRMKQMETWASEAEVAQQKARETKKVKGAKMKVEAATAKEEEARIRLAEAQVREDSLKEQTLNLSPERRLGHFIEQRAQSQDYRGQLGLISLARRDFQQLSDIFADKEALDKKVAEAEGKDAKVLENLGASIDRIVLFVDDLDRCQPEKVVDVLQAVHLLLAFPLFTVVVGVDQRCLKQSLRMQFKGLLTEEIGSNGANGQRDKNATNEDGRPATPLDYLEKIFHVPFHLPKMNETGFRNLIDRLTQPDQTTTPTDQTQQTGQSEQTQEQAENDQHSTQSSVTELQSTSEPQTDLQSDKESKKNESSNHTEENPNVSPSQSWNTPAIVGSVSLQSWEREALRAYHPLIHTPRGATRLVNTYRLVRASVPQSDWRAFSGDKLSDGEFRVAMLLLASAAGYPALARQWFDRLLRTPPSELLSAENATEDDAAWIRFKSVYNLAFKHLTTPVSSDVLCKWIHRVERFTF